MAEVEGSMAYRLPYALQWIWPVPLIVVMVLAPESPWWLVRKGRPEESKRQLLRLTSKKDVNFDANHTVNMMIYTNELERSSQAGTSYLDCFKGVNLRRTEICTTVWAIQVLCGGYMMGFSTYFYERAGLSTSNAFSMTLIQTSLGFIGTVMSWFLMGWFGRRTLFLWGQIGMILCLSLGGFFGIAAKDHQSLDWAVGSMLMVYTFVYDATVGPVCYSLVAELSSTRLRNKTVVLARNWYNVMGLVANVLVTRQLNPSAWNWGTYTCFFWAGSCALCAIWTFFRLPEPKGRSYAELDILFESKVPARKFRTTVVDAFKVEGKSHHRDSTSDKNPAVVLTEKLE
jgi:SP family general alpha glucoside:H+ symporter-like MFS transporter